MIDLPVGVPVGQTFRISDDYIQSMDVRLWADQSVFVVIVRRLLASQAQQSSTGGWSIVYEKRAMLRLARGTTTNHFTFAPIYPSATHVYQFQFEVREVRPLETTQREHPTVRVLASKDDSLVEGNIVVGELQVINRDLLFQAHTADTFTRYHLRVTHRLPMPLRKKGLQLALFAFMHLVIAVFAYHLIIAGPDEEDGVREPHANSHLD